MLTIEYVVVNVVAVVGVVDFPVDIHGYGGGVVLVNVVVNVVALVVVFIVAGVDVVADVVVDVVLAWWC